MSLKILSLNVRGLRDILKRRAIFNFYRTRTNFLCLQETHSNEEDEEIWASEWHGDIIFSHGQRNARGVCICMPKGAKVEMSNIVKDEAGRLIKVELMWKNALYCICNIYAPNSDNPQFFTFVQEAISTSDGYRIIIGDFNLVLDPSKDRIGSVHNKHKSLEILNNTCEELFLVDVWRAKNPDARRYSWYKCRPKLVASRIDLAIIPQGLLDCTDNVGYITGIHSDHLAVYLYLNVQKSERGTGYWKMNTTYLTKPDFVQEMNDIFDEVQLSCTSMSKKSKWEFLKYKIRKVSMEYARNRASEISLIIAQLSEKVTEMEADIASANPDLLEKTKYDLEGFVQEKVKACIFRSRATFYEFGERPSKYYINLERSRYDARTCNALYDPNNKLVTDTQGILRLQEQFYGELFRKNDEVCFKMDNIYDKEVTEAYRIQNSLPFSEEELGKAVKQLPNGKTCGSDGIPIEFFKLHWKRIKTWFFEAVMESYENECLYDSALLGIMNLIPKHNKDTRYLKFLRPITVLNSDYKAIEKTLANRIELALDSIISDTQRGFRKGKHISCNVRMAYELIKYARDNKMDGLILSLDFEKCFDKVSFSALFGCLEFFKFPEYVIKWVKILYTGFQVNTQNNGHFSKRISIQQGLHQGGPASSLLFLVCAEALAILIKIIGT